MIKVSMSKPLQPRDGICICKSKLRVQKAVVSHEVYAHSFCRTRIDLQEEQKTFRKSFTKQEGKIKCLNIQTTKHNGQRKI